jgi:hypothetical protein
MVQPSSESSLGFTSARLFLGQLLEQPSMFTGAEMLSLLAAILAERSSKCSYRSYRMEVIGTK